MAVEVRRVRAPKIKVGDIIVWDSLFCDPNTNNVVQDLKIDERQSRITQVLVHDRWNAIDNDALVTVVTTTEEQNVVQTDASRKPDEHGIVVVYGKPNHIQVGDVVIADLKAIVPIDTYFVTESRRTAVNWYIVRNGVPSRLPENKNVYIFRGLKADRGTIEKLQADLKMANAMRGALEHVVEKKNEAILKLFNELGASAKLEMIYNWAEGEE